MIRTYKAICVAMSNLILRKIPCHLPPLISPIVPNYFHNFFLSINLAKAFKIPNRIPPPLDKISIIPFKRCPYLRSYIAELFRFIWQSGEVPVEWKKACTALIHKKGNTTDPVNFRPITLESVPLRSSLPVYEIHYLLL